MKAWPGYYPLVILQGNGRREEGEWQGKGSGQKKGGEKEVVNRKLVAREAVNTHSYNNSSN